MEFIDKTTKISDITLDAVIENQWNSVAVIVQSGVNHVDAQYQSRADITREGQNVSLTLTNIILSDDGVYRCEVETSTDFLGKTKSTVLEVTGKT